MQLVSHSFLVLIHCKLVTPLIFCSLSDLGLLYVNLKRLLSVLLSCTDSTIGGLPTQLGVNFYSLLFEQSNGTLMLGGVGMTLIREQRVSHVFYIWHGTFLCLHMG